MGLPKPILPSYVRPKPKRGFAASTEIAAIAKNGTGIDQGQGELDPGAHGPGPVPGWQPAASAANNRPIEAVKPETGIGPGNALGQIAIESSAAGVAHYCAFTLIQCRPRHFLPMKGRRRDGAPAAPPAAECAGQQQDSSRNQAPNQRLAPGVTIARNLFPVHRDGCGRLNLQRGGAGAAVIGEFLDHSHEFVTDLRYGFEEARLPEVVAQRLSEFAHALHQRILGDGYAGPNLSENLVLGGDAPAALNQEEKQLEILRPEPKGFTIPAHRARRNTH